MNFGNRIRQILHQPVIAPATKHSPLCAQPVGHKFKGCVTIIIKATAQLSARQPLREAGLGVVAGREVGIEDAGVEQVGGVEGRLDGA